MESHAPSSLWIEESLPAPWGAGAEEIAEALKTRALEHCARRAIVPGVLRVRLGACIDISDEEIVRALARASRGTLLARARVSIERVPARWFCPGCDRILHGKQCRSCGLPGILEAGEERILDSIEPRT